MGKKIVGFTPEAMEVLKNHSFHGNVRELENAVKRVVIVACEQKEILASHFYFIFPDMVRENQTVDTAINTLRDEVLKGSLALGDIEELTILTDAEVGQAVYLLVNLPLDLVILVRFQCSIYFKRYKISKRMSY